MKEALALKNNNMKQSAFDRFRRKGIFLFNKEQLKEKSLTIQNERISKENGNILLCGLCLGIFSKHYFFRHEKVCKENTDASKQINGLPIVMLDTSNKDNLSDDLKNNVLESIRDGEVKGLIMNDRYLLIIGNRLYNKIKRRKRMQ